jgi:hypothetical protein
VNTTKHITLPAPLQVNANFLDDAGIANTHHLSVHYTPFFFYMSPPPPDFDRVCLLFLSVHMSVLSFLIHCVVRLSVCPSVRLFSVFRRCVPILRFGSEFSTTIPMIYHRIVRGSDYPLPHHSPIMALERGRNVDMSLCMCVCMYKCVCVRLIYRCRCRR